MERPGLRRAASTFSTSRNNSQQGAAPVAPHPAAAAAAPPAGQRLQREPQEPQSQALDSQACRLIAVLLRELDAARGQGAAEPVSQERLPAARPGNGKSAKQAAAAAAAGAPAPSSRRSSIPAFRPAGLAPPHRPRSQRPGRAEPAAAAAGQPPAEPHAQMQALQRDNAEMRGQLEALYAHCRRLERRLDSAQGLLGQQVPSPPPSSTVVAAVCSASPRRQPRSPTMQAAVVVASPRAGAAGADLAAAVFEVRSWGACTAE